MKTIEERAREYTHRDGTTFLSGLETAEYEAYKCGATEQLEIDSKLLIVDRAKLLKRVVGKFAVHQIKFNDLSPSELLHEFSKYLQTEIDKYDETH